jgi:hypothetical protein
MIVFKKAKLKRDILFRDLSAEDILWLDESGGDHWFRDDA